MKAIIAVAMMLVSAAAYSQVMKCTSKDGKVEYASLCPPGTTEEKTFIRSSGGSPAPSAAPQQKSLAERDAELKKRFVEQQETQQKAEKKAAESADQRYACDSARSYLKALQEGQRITRTDPKTGERIYREDSEYASETANAQRAVSDFCK